MVAKKLYEELLNIVDFLLMNTWHNQLVKDKEVTSGNNTFLSRTYCQHSRSPLISVEIIS